MFGREPTRGQVDHDVRLGRQSLYSGGYACTLLVLAQYVYPIKSVAAAANLL